MLNWVPHYEGVWGSGVVYVHILNLSIASTWEVICMLQVLQTLEEPLVPTVENCVGHRAWLNALEERKIRPVTGFDHRFFGHPAYGLVTVLAKTTLILFVHSYIWEMLLNSINAPVVFCYCPKFWLYERTVLLKF